MSYIKLTDEDLYDLEFTRGFKRATQGLSIFEEDVITQILVDAKNYRERTRLTEKQCYDYPGWEMLSGMYPRTFGWLIEQGKTECIYFISLDGLQRQEAILMAKAKTQAPTTPLTIENVQGIPVQQQQQQPEKKKGWLRR